jgi:hypothetical protein
VKIAYKPSRQFDAHKFIMNKLHCGYVGVGLLGCNNMWTCKYQHSRGTYCLHLQAFNSQQKSNISEMETVSNCHTFGSLILHYDISQLETKLRVMSFYPNSCVAVSFLTVWYWDMLSCSADVHVFLCSTDGHSLPHPTPLWHQLLGNIHENSGILLWLYVAGHKVCTNWLRQQDSRICPWLI